nr:MAG TPA: hypothetical protein [Caudoviricetes sp.]
MKRINLILLIIGITAAVAGIATAAFLLIPHPPHADIVSVEDVKEFDEKSDFYKVTRWEVVSVDLQGYDKDKNEYGFFGQVKLQDDEEPSYAGLGIRKGGQNVNLEPGDVVYAKTYDYTDNPLFGIIFKGDILYVEKGGAK